MKRYKIDYDKHVDCFELIKDIKSDLVVGNLDAISNPFISYIIPVYKRADLLEETLNSVLAQKSIEQPWDIVVVDNEAGGENETERLIRRINNPRILYYRNQENIGVDSNYNRCIQLARGEWVAMIHGDDLITADHLISSVKFINEAKSNKKVSPAYICQRYVDFARSDEVILNRDEIDSSHSKYAWLLKQTYTDGKLSRQTQIVGVMTGYFAAIPSFGTLMNREIMLKEGGFNRDYGICEDVITPFKLAKKYGVYIAPTVLGYHRFDQNESMKIDTIKKIYASMIDFREYMYSQSVFGRVWGLISRDILNENLLNYCIGLSRFNENMLTKTDFDGIYQLNDVSEIKKIISRIISQVFVRIHKLSDYDEMIGELIDSIGVEINNVVCADIPVLLYGAGTAAKSMIPQLKKKYPKIKFLGCVVTKKDKAQSICKIPIDSIYEYQCDKENVCVMTTTVTWQYQEEMNEVLRNLEFRNIINLLN